MKSVPRYFSFTILLAANSSWSSLKEDATFEEKIGAIGNIQRLMYIMVGDEDADITEFQAPNNVLDILNSDRVDTRKRLIKHDKLWVDGQTTGYLAATTLTTRRRSPRFLRTFSNRNSRIRLSILSMRSCLESFVISNTLMILSSTLILRKTLAS